MFDLCNIAKLVKGKIVGNTDLVIKGICDIELGKKDHIAYIKNNQFLKYLKSNKASVLLVDDSIKLPNDFNKTILKVNDSSLAFVSLMGYFRSIQFPPYKSGINKSASINKNAKLGKNIFIGPNAVIESGVVLGDDIFIGAGTYIGQNTKIGNKTYIHPNVSIYHNINIGKKCYIESGAVIGPDGFGILSNHNNNLRIPHIGTVVIGDDVLIGSNCCIDRGTINSTEIGDNTKLDNMVHIGHNTRIGKNCLICGQTGIAGSVKIDDNVTIAGKVGIIDHIHIGKNSTILTSSCVLKSIKPNSLYSGNPARPHKNRVKEDVIVSKLPNLYKKLFIK